MNIDSLAQLFTMIIVFVLVLGLAYLTSRFAGNIQRGRLRAGNMQVMETMQIATGKYLQIVYAGGKYILIALTKDNVTFLCELQEEQLQFAAQNTTDMDFKKVLAGIHSSRVDEHEKED